MKKANKIVAWLTTAAMAVSASMLPFAASAATYKRGDVDLDGRVGITDVITLCKSLMGDGALTATQAAVADCDGVSGVTTNDALQILRYLVALIDDLGGDVEVEETTEPTEEETTAPTEEETIVDPTEEETVEPTEEETEAPTEEETVEPTEEETEAPTEEETVEPTEAGAKKIDAVWSAGEVTANPGEMIMIPITVTGDVDGLNQFSFTLTYDDGFEAECVDVVQGDAYPDLDMTVDYDTNTIIANTTNMTQNYVAADGSVVCEVYLSIAEDAEAGQYAVILNNMQIFNADGVMLIPNMTDGSIEILGQVTEAPTEEETAAPTEEETAAPTEEETAAPTEEETAAPTEEETEAPTEEETAAPTEEDTEAGLEGTTEVVEAEVVIETDENGNQKSIITVDNAQSYEKVQLTISGGVPNCSISFFTYYGYWDNELGEWVNGEDCPSYDAVFDENGTAVLIVDIPADEHCTSLQIGISYYHSWSNEASDMVPNDQEGLTWEVVAQLVSNEE